MRDSDMQYIDAAYKKLKVVSNNLFAVSNNDLGEVIDAFGQAAKLARWLDDEDLGEVIDTIEIGLKSARQAAKKMQDMSTEIERIADNLPE